MRAEEARVAYISSESACSAARLNSAGRKLLCGCQTSITGMPIQADSCQTVTTGWVKCSISDHLFQGELSLYSLMFLRWGWCWFWWEQMTRYRSFQTPLYPVVCWIICSQNLSLLPLGSWLNSLIKQFRAFLDFIVGLQLISLMYLISEGTVAVAGNLIRLYLVLILPRVPIVLCHGPMTTIQITLLGNINRLLSVAAPFSS